MNHSKAASRENEPALCHVVYMVTYAIRSTRRCVTAETASQCKERSRKEYSRRLTIARHAKCGGPRPRQFPNRRGDELASWSSCTLTCTTHLYVNFASTASRDRWMMPMDATCRISIVERVRQLDHHASILIASSSHFDNYGYFCITSNWSVVTLSALRSDVVDYILES